MDTAMLFPGQASQYVGMGKDYYDRFPMAREIYSEANGKLGFDIKDMSFSGDLEELTKTKNAQPAILLHSIMVLAVLHAAGVRPRVVAGHSLGEFSALVAAGCLRAMDALLIVRRRGELMYQAGLERPGTMAAIIGLEKEKVEECVQEASSKGIIVIANYNSPRQLAVSGEVEAVEAAVQAAKAHGARKAMKLQVSGAFHSPLMKQTALEFKKYLEKFELRNLRVPWIANVTGREVRQKELVVELLCSQLSSPVLWVECMRTLVAHDGSSILEVGPGRVLTGLLKQIDGSIDALPLSDVESAEKVILGVG